MKQKKQRCVTLTSCEYCSNYRTEFVNAICSFSPLKFGLRKIPDIKTIPDWCPLPICIKQSDREKMLKLCDNERKKLVFDSSFATDNAYNEGRLSIIKIIEESLYQKGKDSEP